MYRSHKQDPVEPRYSLPADWEETWSKEHNRPYFANRRTGESSWTRPEDPRTRRKSSGSTTSNAGRARSAPGSQNRRFPGRSQQRRSEGQGRDEARRSSVKEEVRKAFEDANSSDSALWRMTSWAERFCGRPEHAVRNIWRGRKAIERVFNTRSSNFDPRDSTGLSTRALGRKLTQSWLAARTRQSQGMALTMANCGGAEAQEIAGLLMYLEMVISLVPDVSADRLVSIWELPEPSWASEHRKSMPLKFDPTNPLRLLEPKTMPQSRPEAKPKETKVEMQEEEKKKGSLDEEQPQVRKMHTWDIKRSFKFCKIGEERLFKGKLTLLPEEMSSVRAGVEHMNQQSAVDECCMIYNPGTKFYHVLYQEGERQTALKILDIPEPCGFLTAVILAGYNLIGVAEKPSAYVVCRLGDEEYRSETVKDSSNPKWNSDDFQYHVNLREDDQKALRLEVFDGKFALDERSLGKVSIDLVSLAPKEMHKKILRLEEGGLGQIELQLEFIPKREYQSRFSPDSSLPDSIELKRQRKKQEKPSWCIFEQEMVFDQEISAFLKTLKPLPKKPIVPVKESSELPLGWQAAWDAQRNAFYFHNKYLGKSVSTRKAVAQVEAEVGGLPPGWGAAWDSRYNAYYFYNHQLQKTVWTRGEVEELQSEIVVSRDLSLEKYPTIEAGIVMKEKPVASNSTEWIAGPEQDIQENTVLRCISDEEAIVFENAESSLVLSSVVPGSLVTAAGPAVNIDGFWMVPVQPEGAIELAMVEVVNENVEVVNETPGGEIVPVCVIIAGASSIKRKVQKGIPTVSCKVQVLGKPSTVCQTKKINDTDPFWNEEFQIEDFSVGDPLFFSVWDNEEAMGTARMSTERLQRENFDGVLQLSLKGATLRISAYINDGGSRPTSDADKLPKDDGSKLQATASDWTSDKNSKRRRFLTRVGVLAKMGKGQSDVDELGEGDMNMSRIPTIEITPPPEDSKKTAEPYLLGDDKESRNGNLDMQVPTIPTSPPPEDMAKSATAENPRKLRRSQTSPSPSTSPKPSPRLRASPRVKVEDPDSD